MTARSYLAVPMICLFAAACGDDGPADTAPAADFSITIESPDSAAILFANTPIDFVAVLDAGDAEDLTVQWRWEFGDESSIDGTSPTVAHTYTEPGSYLVTVEATDASGASATAATTIEVLAAADLAVSIPIVSVPNDTVTPTDPFRVTVDLRNEAASAPAAFDVVVFALPAADLVTGSYLDPAAADALAATAIEIERRSFAGLPAGDQSNIDISGITIPGGTTSGEYAIMVQVDPARANTEVNRANNNALAARTLAFVDTSGEGPDLLARDVVARPTRVNVLESVTVSASIINAGTQTALLFPYDIILSQDTVLDDSDTVLARGNVDNASPGSPVALPAVTLDLDPPITTLGEYFILVQPDPDNTITETNETNNVGISGRILVTDEPLPGIDINPAAFDIQPRTTFIDGTVNVTATVSNQGVDPIGAQFFCRIHLSPDDSLEDGPGGDRVLTTVLVDPVGPAATVDLSATARVQGFFTEGTYFAFLSCDPSQAVAESDEENNVRRLDGNVIIAGQASLNLRPGAASVTPTSVANEALATVSVEVCNNGSAGSATSVVRVHISSDPIFDSSDTVLLQSVVPAVEPGQCASIVADVPAVCDTFDSTYTVFVVADATGIVNEVDETDNRITLPTPLTITGLICQCENDRFEPNDSIAQAAQLSATSRTYEDLTTCATANDWYRIPLLRGESIRASASFNSARGNLDMRLIGTDLSSVLSSSSTDGDREEVVYFVAPRSGDYYLNVFGRTAQDRNVYDLELSVSARTSGIDIVPVTARVSATNPVPGQVLDLSFDLVNLGDTATGPFTTWAYLSRDTTINPAEDVRVAELAITSLSDRLSRTIPVTIPIDTDGGTWYLGVVADSRAQISELDETNNSTFTPPFDVDNNCFDVFEPNNAATDARLLDLSAATPPVTFADLLACTGNRDFYEVCGEDGSFVTITAAFDTANGDIDIRLYDELGAQVDRSEGTTGTEIVSVDYLAGERCFTLELYVAGIDRNVPYTLTIDTSTAPEELACSRVEEPNNTFGAALPLRDFFDDATAVCPVDDDDFYTIALQAGSNVSFQLVAAPGQTAVPEQLRLAIFNPSRGFVTAGVSAVEVLRPNVGVTGQWFVRVRSNGDGPRNQPYGVAITGVPGIDLIATDLLLEPAVAAPGASVRYSFNYSNTRDVAAAAAQYQVWLSTDPTLSPSTDTLLRTLDLPALTAFESRIEGRRFDVPTTIVDGGLFFVIIHVDSASTVVEFSDTNNFAATELIIAPRCAADTAEPNNFRFETADLTDVDGEELTSCNDDDWFTFTAPRAGAYNLTIEFEHASGDLNLTGWRGTATTPFAVSDSITDDESINFTATAGETFTFLVDAFYDDTNTYTVVLTP